MALESECNNSSNASNLKYAATAIEHDEDQSACDNRQLINIRAILSRARNRATAPINLLLPTEILCHIFSFFLKPSKPFQERNHHPTILASVCSSWRRLVISTRSFWGHLLLRSTMGSRGAGNLLRRTQLYLGRSCGALFHLEFDGQWATAMQEANVVSLLAPHMTLLRSLDYSVNNTNFDRPILACWLEHGTPGSLTRLFIQAPHMQNRNTWQCLPDNPTLLYPYIDQFLRPIQSLSLSKAHMDWGCAAFTGLVELNMHRVESTASPTAAQFAGILAASPLLRSMKLYRVEIRFSEGLLDIPVRHAHLQNLDLENLDPTSFEMLFSILLPCSDKLDLCLISNSLDGVADFLCQHWRGVHASVLRLGGRGLQGPWLQEILTSIKGTQTLALQDLNLSAAILEILAGSLSGTIPASIPPRFCTVELTRCSILSEGAFRDMINAHPIQKLKLFDCKQSGPFRPVAKSKELCAWLESVVPDVCVWSWNMKPLE